MDSGPGFEICTLKFEIRDLGGPWTLHATYFFYARFEIEMREWKLQVNYFTRNLDFAIEVVARTGGTRGHGDCSQISGRGGLALYAHLSGRELCRGDKKVCAGI